MGFNRKRLNQLLDELNAEIKSVFGENFNVSPESPDGQINGIIAESHANLWEIAEHTYNAFNPSAATGAALSNLVQLNGIKRMQELYSYVNLTLKGDPGTVITANNIVSDGNNIRFYTEADAKINVLGEVDVSAKCAVAGPIEAAINTLINIDTPVAGWHSVTNLKKANPGRNEESDSELRARRELSISRAAVAIIDAIYAEVKAVPGVTQVKVLENDNAVSKDGMPPHSIHVIVSGGDDAKLARAIFIKKTIGASTFGTTKMRVQDSQGVKHDISFSRPKDIPIYVEVNLTRFKDYPARGDDLIKYAIIDYTIGILMGGRGFFMGDDVIHSQLYTPINTIPGHTVDSLYIRTKTPVDGRTDDIPIKINEIAYFDFNQIVVN